MATENELESSEPTPPTGSTRKRRLPLLILGILVIALGGWALQRYLYSRHHVSTANAQVDGHITVIAPRISAFITRVLVDDNRHVKAGDTLVVLDDRDLRVKLEQAEAELRDAQATVGTRGRAGQAQAELQATRAQAASATATVAAAESDYKKAAADLERYRGLAA